MFFWRKIWCFFDQKIKSPCPFHLYRSPRLLGVQSWNLNWNQISDDIFVFGSWGVALSSRSRDSLKDRDAIHEATSIQHRTVLCDYWEFRAQNLVGIEISDSIFVFLYWCATLSSRSWASLRDRDAIREATSIQRPSDFLCDYWELRAQTLVGIRNRMLYFFFKTWCAALSSRSREPSRDRGVTHEAIYNERNIW